MAFRVEVFDYERKSTRLQARRDHWSGASASRRGVHAKMCVTSNKCIAVRKVATPLRELTCHVGSHSVTCHPAEVTFPPLPQPKLVLD